MAAGSVLFRSGRPLSAQGQKRRGFARGSICPTDYRPWPDLSPTILLIPPTVRIYCRAGRHRSSPSSAVGCRFCRHRSGCIHALILCDAAAGIPVRSIGPSGFSTGYHPSQWQIGCRKSANRVLSGRNRNWKYRRKSAPDLSQSKTPDD